MPNHKKRSFGRTVILRKGNNKKVPKEKMSFKEALMRGYTPKESGDYLAKLQRYFGNVKEDEKPPIRCGLHKFYTDNWVDWNKHMVEVEHEMMGSIACVHCNKPIRFENFPVFPGMTKMMHCKKCRRYTRIYVDFPWDGPATIEVIR